MYSTNKSTLQTEVSNYSTMLSQSTGLRKYLSKSQIKRNTYRVQTEQNYSLQPQTPNRKRNKSEYTPVGYKTMRNLSLFQQQNTQKDKRKELNKDQIKLNNSNQEYQETLYPKQQHQQKVSLLQFYTRNRQNQITKPIPEKFKDLSKILDQKRLEITSAILQVDQNGKELNYIETNMKDDQQEYFWGWRWIKLHQQHLEFKEIERNWCQIELQEQVHQNALMKQNSAIIKNDKILSLENIKFIEAQFQLPQSDRDYCQLDKILFKNKFISQFVRNVRINLIENSSLLIVDQNKQIITNKEPNNLLYIVLRGYCGVFARIQTTYGEQVKLQLNSFSDGQQFSALNIVARRDNLQTEQQFDVFNQHELMEKRFNVLREIKQIETNIIALEDSIMLIIDSDVHDRIIIKSAENQIDFKLKQLTNQFKYTSQSLNFIKSGHKCTCFTCDSHFSINIHTRRYHNKRVWREQIDMMYIVVSGQIKSCIEQRYTRGLRNECIRPANQYFKFKEMTDKNCKSLDRNHDPCDQSKNHSFVGSVSEKKTFDKGFKIRLGQDLMQVTHHINQSLFNIGDIICGRALLNENEYYNNSRNNTSFKQSKLTLVANSKEVVVYTLDMKQFATLPEALQVDIREKLLKLKEFDDYNVEQIIQQEAQWDRTNEKKEYFDQFMNFQPSFNNIMGSLGSQQNHLKQRSLQSSPFMQQSLYVTEQSTSCNQSKIRGENTRSLTKNHIQEKNQYKSYPFKQYRPKCSRQDVVSILQKHDQLRNKVQSYIDYMDYSNIQEVSLDQTLVDTKHDKSTLSSNRMNSLLKTTPTITNLEYLRDDKENHINVQIKKSSQLSSPPLKDICFNSNMHGDIGQIQHNNFKTNLQKGEVWNFIHKHERILENNSISDSFKMSKQNAIRLLECPPFLSCASIIQSMSGSCYNKVLNTQLPQSKTIWVQNYYIKSGFNEDQYNGSPYKNQMQSNPLTSSNGSRQSRPEVSQSTLLNKFEYLRNYFVSNEDNRRTYIEQSDLLKSSILDNSYQWHLKSNQIGTFSEQQEQDFSHQPSAEIIDNDPIFYKVDSFTFQNSLEEVDGMTALDTYKLNQIQEQSDETEGDYNRTQQNYIQITPSIQDIDIQGDVLMKQDNTCFQDQKVRYSVNIIDKNIKAKEQFYTSSTNDTFTQQNQNQDKKSFDTYYLNYVQEDMSEIQNFLEHVKSAKSKLKSSLKDLYRTFNHNSSDNNEIMTPQTYPSLNNQFGEKYSCSSISSESLSQQSENTLIIPQVDGQEGFNKMQRWIVNVSQDLESIECLRTKMLTAIQDIKSYENVNTSSLEQLKGMKDQIHNHFWNVENAVRVINQEYASKLSVNTFSSNNTCGNNERNFETQVYTEDQSFENYYKQTKQNKNLQNRQFQTKTNQLFEYEEEESFQ